MNRFVVGLVALALGLCTEEADAQHVDPPDLQQLYDEGVAALASDHHAEAAEKLGRVASQSADPARRETAARLAVQARSQQQRHAVAPPLEEAIDARTNFMGGVAALGIGFYGVAAPIAAGVHNPHRFIGLYTATAATTIFLPYLATRNEHITPGMATLAVSGGGLGIGHGIALYVLATGGVPSARGLFATASAVSLAELAGGYVLARETNMSSARAGMITAGGLYGAGWAVAGNVMAVGHKVEDQDRALAGIALAGSIGGGLAGDYYARRRSLSAGDASIVSFGGLVGLYAAVGPLVIANVESPRIVAGTVLASHLLGLVVGDRVIEGKDFSRSDAGRVALFTLGGGLLGIGLAALSNPERHPEDAYALGVSLGLAGGFVGGALLANARPEGARLTSAGPAVNAVPMILPNRGLGVGVASSW